MYVSSQKMRVLRSLHKHCKEKRDCRECEYTDFTQKGFCALNMRPELWKLDNIKANVKKNEN